MTRPTTGLVGTRAEVIPAAWEAHHIPTVDRTRQMGATLYAGPAEGEDRYVYDPVTETSVLNVGSEIWSGTIRLQRMERGGGGQESGGQTVTTADYLAVLPESVNGAVVGAYIRLGDGSDEQIDGTLMRVSDVLKGSLRWERDLLLTENLG